MPGHGASGAPIPVARSCWANSAVKESPRQGILLLLLLAESTVGGALLGLHVRPDFPSAAVDIPPVQPAAAPSETR